MSEIINFLTSKEIVMVYIVAGIACALYFVIHMIDKLYYQKRKQKQNTKELNRLVEDINYELAKEREEQSPIIEEVETKEEPIYIEPVLEKIEPVITPIEDKKAVVETLSLEDNSSEAVIESFVEELVEEPVNIEEKQNKVEVLNVESNTLTEDTSLDYTSIEPNQTEAQEQLRKLTEALEQAEEESKNIDLTSYEEMQEKEAIISLEELIERSKEMYENNELTQYADEGNEPISLEDLERKVQETLLQEAKVEDAVEEVIEEVEAPQVEETLKMDDFYTIKDETKNSKTAYSQYKSMPIISPVYGIEKQASNTDLELENTANYEKLDEEIKKTNEFIMTLKELQENLD